MSTSCEHHEEKAWQELPIYNFCPNAQNAEGNEILATAQLRLQGDSAKIDDDVDLAGHNRVLITKRRRDQAASLKFTPADFAENKPKIFIDPDALLAALPEMKLPPIPLLKYVLELLDQFTQGEITFIQASPGINGRNESQHPLKLEVKPDGKTIAKILDLDIQECAPNPNGAMTKIMGRLRRVVNDTATRLHSGGLLQMAMTRMKNWSEEHRETHTVVVNGRIEGVLLYPVENGSTYFVRIIGIPDIKTCGNSREDALSRARVAIENYLSAKNA